MLRGLPGKIQKTRRGVMRQQILRYCWWRGTLYLGHSKKINLPNTSDFSRKKHLVWKVLNFGITLGMIGLRACSFGVPAAKLQSGVRSAVCPPTYTPGVEPLLLPGRTTPTSEKE
jgi:hypothetical protein